jgi:hypothetical protein
MDRQAQLFLDQPGQLGVLQSGLTGALPIQKIQYRSG